MLVPTMRRLVPLATMQYHRFDGRRRPLPNRLQDELIFAGWVRRLTEQHSQSLFGDKPRYYPPGIRIPEPDQHKRAWGSYEGRWRWRRKDFTRSLLWVRRAYMGTESGDGIPATLYRIDVGRHVAQSRTEAGGSAPICAASHPPSYTP